MSTLIYVHHYFNDLLSQKLFHNVSNKQITRVSNEITEIYFEYGGRSFKTIFNPEINNNQGIHLLDYFSGVKQKSEDKKLNDIHLKGADNFTIPNRYKDLIINQHKWIITYFTMEKCLINDEMEDVKNGGTAQISKGENELNELINHYILSDNMFINGESSKLNIFNPFTNIIFQWNENINIRVFYDFKIIFERLVPDYKIGYGIRVHKPHRIEIAEKLKDIEGVFVSQTNVTTKHSVFPQYQRIEGIYLNDYEGKTDFHNIFLNQNMSVGIDFFMRILPRAKLQICDESWSFTTKDYKSQYLSEKTIGLVLSNIPFVSTHPYVYECLNKLIGVRLHPFYNESKYYMGNVDRFTQFIKDFLKNFDNNHKLCVEWVQECHNLFMERIEKENSMLDFIINHY
jgi:hypothetical protein